LKNIFAAALCKTVVAISLGATLSACSNGPSNGEVKEEIIKNVLHDCSLMSIDKFEKINGMPDAHSDRVYQVQVAYTIELEPMKENRKLVEKMPDRLLEISDMIDRYRAYRKKYDALDEKLEAESNGDHMGVLKKLNQDPELSAMREEHDAFEKIYPQFYLYKGDEARMLLGRMRSNIGRACPETNFTGFFPEQIEDFGESVSKSFEATFTMRKTDNGWKMAR